MVHEMGISQTQQVYPLPEIAWPILSTPGPLKPKSLEFELEISLGSSPWYWMLRAIDPSPFGVSMTIKNDQQKNQCVDQEHCSQHNQPDFNGPYLPCLAHEPSLSKIPHKPQSVRTHLFKFQVIWTPFGSFKNCLVKFI